jgi:hypothetical protein
MISLWGMCGKGMGFADRPAPCIMGLGAIGVARNARSVATS